MSIQEININFSKKQKLMIFSVVAFLCTLVATTYAWIAHDVAGVPNAINISSAGVSLSFRGTSPEIIADLAPGESIVKEFELNNFTSDDETYNLYWKVANNSFTDKNHFMYTLKNAETGEIIVGPRYLPLSPVHLLYNQPIPANSTVKFALTITYILDPFFNQTQNANLYFEGDLSMDATVQGDNVLDMVSIIVDGSPSQTLPTPITDYTVDNTRTYCTDGSEISLNDGVVSVTKTTPTTTCELHLNSSPAAEINENIYNLLIVDYNTGLSDINTLTKYYYKGDTISLPEPIKEGYVFTGWDITGAGTTVNNNTLTMGSTYSYAKATWNKGYYNKTIQTCTQAAPATYTRTYNLCEQGGVTQWTYTDRTCVITASGYYSYLACSSSYSWAFSQGSSCPIITATACNSANVGRLKSGTSCTWNSASYGWTAATSGNAGSSCTPRSVFPCGSSTVNQTDRQCTPAGYSYVLNTTNELTDINETCELSSFACTATEYNNITPYVTRCEPHTYNYEYIPSVIETNVCSVETQPTCELSSEGITYTSDCTFVPVE